MLTNTGIGTSDYLLVRSVKSDGKNNCKFAVTYFVIHNLHKAYKPFSGSFGGLLCSDSKHPSMVSTSSNFRFENRDSTEPNPKQVEQCYQRDRNKASK